MNPIAELGRIEVVREVSPGLWDIVVTAPHICSLTQAGQFVHVRVTDGWNPFLRRPLSVGPIDSGTLRLIFSVRGEGTRLLSKKKPGDGLDLIGPLGKPFILPERNKTAVFVTGGIGVVPLLALDDRMKGYENRIFLLGVRSDKHLPIDKSEVERRRVRLASDDGSVGFPGNVVGLFTQILNEIDIERTVVYACGPNAMLSGLVEVCQANNIPTFVSLEVSMGCGVGACQSCAVLRSDGEGYLLVCKDGPVFDMNAIRIESKAE